METTPVPDIEGRDLCTASPDKVGDPQNPEEIEEIALDRALAVVRGVNQKKFAVLNEMELVPPQAVILSARVEALIAVLTADDPKLAVEIDLHTEVRIGRIFDSIAKQAQEAAERHEREAAAGLLLPQGATEGLIVPDAPVELPKQPLRLLQSGE